MKMIKKGCRSILRISNPGEMISADAFEKLFQEHIGSMFAVEIVSAVSLFGQILDCFSDGSEIDLANLQIERFFSEKIALYDFFSPGFGAFSAAPFFLEKRNQGFLKTRLLLIAHAPGAMVMEWALIAPLLKPGDLIIAPSSNAKAEILLIAPQLSPFVEVIPHPVHLLPKPSQTPVSTLSSFRDKRFVSLSRIHPDKLIHRQIEAFAELCQRGKNNLKLDIAGPLSDSQGLELHYSRFLKALVKRLGLEDRVNFLGPVYGDQAKADLFAGACALLNLSVSLDESFGKSIVEGLGSGLPVICTDWNGFNETAGDTGLLVPVVFKGKGNPDLRPEDLAKVMANVLASPIAEADCRAQAKRSQPQKIASRYKQVLEQALFMVPETGTVASEDKTLELDFDRSGLLATLAPLQIFSYAEIFTFYLEHFYENMKITTGACEISTNSTPGAIVQGIMNTSLSRPLSKFLAHQPEKIVTMLQGRDNEIKKTQYGKQPDCSSYNDFFRRLANVGKTCSSQRSQEISLLYCALNDQLENFRFGITELLAQGYQSCGITYLTIELKLLEKQLSEAFVLSLDSFNHDYPTEFDCSRLRQLAKIARKMGAPEKALPKLDDWLEQFPGAPDAGVVWLDLCANAAIAGQEFLPEAKRAFLKAYELLGDIPALQKLALRLALPALT